MHKKSLGLPGGPNQYVTDISEFISIEGYKRDSPDVNNPYNIIPSGNITMEGVDFAVKGRDNLGNELIMEPGGNYQFPGDSVLETRLAQNGIEVPSRNGVRNNKDGSESTHLMAAEKLENGDWVGFPRLFQNPDNTWVDMSSGDWKNAYQEALQRGEVIEFGKDSVKAIAYGEGSWKPKMKRGGGLLNKKVKCKSCGWSWDAADGGNDLTSCHKCGGEGLVQAQTGGQIKLSTTYKNYILGDDNTEEAEKTYDKLNRIYYKQSKEAGMSPANFIMTHVIGNS